MILAAVPGQTLLCQSYGAMYSGAHELIVIDPDYSFKILLTKFGDEAGQKSISATGRVNVICIGDGWHVDTQIGRSTTTNQDRLRALSDKLSVGCQVTEVVNAIYFIPTADNKVLFGPQVPEASAHLVCCVLISRILKL